MRFIETLGHETGKNVIAEAELLSRGLARVRVKGLLRLVDLSAEGLAQLGRITTFAQVRSPFRNAGLVRCMATPSSPTVSVFVHATTQNFYAPPSLIALPPRQGNTARLPSCRQEHASNRPVVDEIRLFVGAVVGCLGVFPRRCLGSGEGCHWVSKRTRSGSFFQAYLRQNSVEVRVSRPAAVTAM